MRAALRSLDVEPDPATLRSDPAELSLLARMIVGPSDGPREESFDVTVCSPEWLAHAAGSDFYDACHHLVVNVGFFDKHSLHRWLAQRVESVQGDTWSEIAERIARLGYWEFEDYRPD